MMLAAIDAGSNTLRLLIGRVVGDRVVPELYLRRISRLAGGFTEETGLSPAAMERTLAAFREFAETCHRYQIKQIMAVGTAAFRSSLNGESFAARVRSTTRLPLEIISGEMEARYMSSGVLSALDPMPGQALIIDIGGGSTEFVLCSHQDVIWSRSMPLGVVRLIEKHSSAPARHQFIHEILAEMIEEMTSACQSAGIDSTALELVGTAGTVTTLAALDMEMTEYDWRRVNNYALAPSRLQYWQTRLTSLCLSDREALPGMEAGRGDLILPGLEILLYLMDRLDRSRLTVSDFGILEGLLISLHGCHKT